MKLVIIILTTCLMQVSASTFAQKLTYTKQGASLEEIFKEIRKQTGYNVFYADTKIDDSQKLDVNFQNTDLKDVLDQVVVNRALEYTIDNKNIIIKVKEPSLLDKVKAVFAAIDVSGVVVDERGLPMLGVTVRIKNANRVTTTDQNGVFVLKGVNDNDILVITFIGYKSKEVHANSDLRKIQLEISSSQLDQVQIEAYGQSSKRTSVNDITTIKGADFEGHPIDNPLKALEGRVPGLIITPASGLPGAAMTVQLRGQNSLTGEMTQPLFVLDGVPIVNNINTSPVTLSTDVLGSENFRSSLSFINPADIESIDVLKDADATSIYGSKGANGVILITTKKGKAGDTRIFVGSLTGFSKLTKEFPMMNTQQYLQVRRDAFLADGNPVPTDPHGEYDLTLWDQNRYTDWQKVLMGGNAFYNFNNASISGGNALVQYMVSGHFLSQTYIFPGQAKSQSGGTHFNISGYSPNQKFHASLTGEYTGIYSPDPWDQSGVAAYLPPNAPALYKANGELNWEPGPTGYHTWLNPLAILANERYSKTRMLAGSFELSYKISPSFMLRGTAGIHSTNNKGFKAQAIASMDPAYGANNYGISDFFGNSSDSWSVEPQLVFNHDIGRGALNIIVGASLDQQSYYNQDITASQYRNDALLHNLASAGSFGASNSAGQYRSEGVYAKATYNWSDKYLLSANFRRDGSSRFGPGNQFGNFASGGIGWVFSNEGFFKKGLPVVSFGKLRASLGTSGNDGIGDYRAVAYYKTVVNGANFFSQPVTYQGIPTLYSAGPNNPYIHWETVTKLTLGVDLGFFNDRLLITGNYFRNRSSSQLLSVHLPSTTGGTDLLINMPANIQNMGGDLSITTVNIKTKNFRWSSSGTIAFQRNKLLSLPPAEYTSLLDIFAYYRSINQSPVGKAFSGTQAVNVFRGVDPTTGMYLFTGDGGKAVTADMITSGHSTLVNLNPQFDGGLGNTVTYKGLSLEVFLRFVKKNGLNYLYQGTGPLGYDGSAYGLDNTNQPRDLLNYWKKPGDIAPIQRLSASGSYTDPATGINYDLNYAYHVAQGSTAAYTDASYIRVQSVNLSYNIPASWAKKIGMRNLTFRLSAENLWTITGYKGFDPETQSIGQLPPLRTITAGFNLGL